MRYKVTFSIKSGLWNWARVEENGGEAFPEDFSSRNMHALEWEGEFPFQVSRWVENESRRGRESRFASERGQVPAASGAGPGEQGRPEEKLQRKEDAEPESPRQRGGSLETALAPGLRQGLRIRLERGAARLPGRGVRVRGEDSAEQDRGGFRAQQLPNDECDRGEGQEREGERGIQKNN